MFLLRKCAPLRNVTNVSTMWYDKQCINLLRNFVGVDRAQKSRQYDKSKKHVEIHCLNAVVTYNKCMGDFDLVDSITEVFHITVCSKKKYHRILFSIFRSDGRKCLVSLLEICYRIR
jgi:hypothetical protein